MSYLLIDAAYFPNEFISLMYKLVFIFPSRSRPQKFFAALENIKSKSLSDNYEILAVIDDDDLTMNNDEVKQKLNSYPEVKVIGGLSRNKIHAINRGAEGLESGEILIVMSDDIIWDVHGFDNIIREAFNQYSPNLDFAIHFPELHAGNRTIIVSILGFNLYKQLGYLYWHEYISVYSDNEFTEVTRLMNKYVFINKPLFTHAHPMWTQHGWDEQYRKTESPANYEMDGATFKRRKAINFGL